jgi:hypothetical protein
MGLPEFLAAASLAITAVSTVASISANNKAASAAYDQVRYDYQAADTELQFQRRETQIQRDDVAKQAVEQKSDRMRRAIYELGALQVATGESGIGASTAARLEAEAGYAAGVDLSRIENSRKNAMRTLDRQDEASLINRNNRVVGATFAGQSAERSAKAGNTKAILGGFSSALQIGANYYSDTQRQEYYRGARDNALQVKDARIGASQIR